MNIYICLLLTLILMFYALVKNALTIPGLLTAGILTFGITYFGGYPFYVMIILIFFIDKIFAHITKKSDDKTRDINQIIATLFVPFVAIMNYQLFHNKTFLLVATICLAGCLADTLASTIGRLSKHHLYLRRITYNHHNLSGSISILGLLASYMGALLIGIVYYFLINTSYNTYMLIGLLGVLCGLIDSFLGTYFQVLYECPKCKKITEEEKHCGKETKKIKGIRFIDNTMVNLLSEVIIFLISLVVL